MNKFIWLLGLCFFSNLLFAKGALDYQLKPEKIADGTYVFIGAKEDFSYQNGGNIVNTGFIVTDEGIVIIDSGPSKLYGQQMRHAIREVSDKPILKILITHHHPDHFLGNQAFEDIPIFALAGTIDLLKRDAAGFLDNIYRMAGPWMSGTEVRIATIQPLNSMQEQIGNHSLRYISMNGHTSSDLMVFDETTGVLFSGDLVFHNRALTTPHAEPERWLETLDKILAMDYKIIVPGHGEVARNKAPVKQTREYLVWLESTIAGSVEDGLAMNDVLSLPVPSDYKKLGVFEREFTRSVTHRYPIHEQDIFNNN